MSGKRKSTGVPVLADSPLAEKSRIPPETPKEVSEKGLSFLKFLTNAKDKGGHSISENFLNLPSQDEFPDYYEFTQLPIALDTIQGKLERNEYPTMTKVESDLKRMVFNAKAFNEKTSELHRDAEKIRKMVTHHMKERKLNPAYADPTYASFPTPLPDEEGEDEDEDEAGEQDEEQVPQLDGVADTAEAGDTKPRRKFLLRGPSNTTPGESEGAPQSENEDSSKAPGRQRLRLTKPSVEKERLRRQSNPATSDAESQEPPIKKIKLRAPAPEKDNVARDSSAAASDMEAREESKGSKRPKLLLRRQSEEQEGSRRMSSSTPAAADKNEGFEGKSMSKAQEKIVQEMLELYDDDGETHIAGPFVHLPSREIKDYYQVIKHPVSLKAMLKLVRGIKGREKPTGKTLLQTWQDFEEEASLIWSNARLYNEDGSEISELAGQLEEYFQKRLAQAKAVVQDPPELQSQKIKLHVKEPEQTPKLKLIAGSKRPAEEMSNYSVDKEALKRQRQLVQDGVNGRIGQAPTATPPVLAREGSSTSAKGDDASTVRLQVDGVKGAQQHKEMASISHQLAAAAAGVAPSNDLQPLAAAMMPPPPTTPRPLSQPKPPPIPLPRNPFDTWRRLDRPEVYRWPYTTITKVIIESHPSLKLGTKAYRWELYPWPEFNYATEVLPIRKECHRMLVSPLFIKPTIDRPFVTSMVILNGVRQFPAQGIPSSIGDGRAAYDLALNMDDLNEIEVQCFTQPADPCPLQDVIFDKYTVVIHPRAV